MTLRNENIIKRKSIKQEARRRLQGLSGQPAPEAHCKARGIDATTLFMVLNAGTKTPVGFNRQNQVLRQNTVVSSVFVCLFLFVCHFVFQKSLQLNKVKLGSISFHVEEYILTDNQTMQ